MSIDEKVHDSSIEKKTDNSESSSEKPVQKEVLESQSDLNKKLNEQNEYQRREDRPQGFVTSLIPGKDELLGSLKKAEKQLASATAGDKQAGDKVGDSAVEAPSTATDVSDAVGLNGKFQSPDGKREFNLVSGACYDETGILIGQLGKDGAFTPNRERDRSHVNSSFEGWKFQGAEDGQKRSFECRRDIASGKLFLPGEGNEKVEYDVRMGMIINKTTGEQLGNLISPQETLDGKLQGGAIQLKEPSLTVPLADLKDAVFDLQLMGQTGVESRRLQGVSLGPEKLADGRPNPDRGGLFNIQDGLDTLGKHRKDLDAKEQSNTGVISYLSGEQARQSQLNRSDSDFTNAQMDALRHAIESGDASQIRQIKETVDTLKYSDDPLLAQRQKLDSNERTLELLPEDTSNIHGTVHLAVRGEGGVAQQFVREIKAGFIVGDDGKPAYRIANQDGQMMVVDVKTNQTQPASDLARATWNMTFTEGEHPQRVTWISAEKNGFVSVNDMMQKAHDYTKFANALKERDGSEQAVQRFEIVTQAEQAYANRLTEIRQHGIQSEQDLKFVLSGPTEVRRTALEAPKPESGEATKPLLKPIEVPNLGKDDPASKSFSVKNIKEGDLRIGPEVYSIKDGDLLQNGKKVGELQSDYRAQLEDGRNIDLKDTNRVMMRFKIDGESQGREHRLLSLGPARIAENGMKIRGGLVQADELIREGMQCRQEANEGNCSYFANKPYLNEMLRMDGIDASVDQLQRNVETQMHMLQTNVDFMFANAFKPGYVNNRLDSAIKATQEVSAALGVTATTANQVAREGQDVHKQTNDAIVTGVTTVATAGFGTWFTAGRALAAGTAAGATLSVAGRASSDSSEVRNAISGGVEGFANALGGVGGKWLQGAKETGHIGAMGQVLFRAGDALTQSVMNTGAGAIREGDARLMSVQSVLVNFGAQLAGDATGVGIGKMAGALEKRMAQNIGNVIGALNIDEGELFEMLSKNPGKLSGKLSELGVTEAQLGLEMSMLRASKIGGEIASSGMSAYANGFSAASAQAIEVQKQQIAEKYHIDPSMVNGDMLWKNVNWEEVATFCHESGITAAQSGMITAASMRPGIELMQRRMANQRPAEGPSDVQTPPHGNRTPHEGQSPVDSKPSPDPASRARPDGARAHGSARQSDNAESSDTNDSRVDRRPDRAGSLSDRLNRAAQVEAGLLPDQPHLQNRTLKFADGTQRVESAFPDGGSVDVDASGKVTRIADATGAEYLLKHKDGELVQVEGTNAERFTKTEYGWYREHEGTMERVSDVTVNKDGEISYKKTVTGKDFSTDELKVDNQQLTRRLDGSVVDQHGKLVEANLKVEQSKIETLLSHIQNPTDRAFAQAYLKGFDTRRGFSNMSDVEAAKTLHEVSGILNSHKGHLPPKERAALVTEILGNITDTYALNQGNSNTCNAATVAVQMYARCPSEAVRIIKEAVTTGTVKTANGDSISLKFNDVMPDAQTHQAHRNELMRGSQEHNERNLADKILQGAIVNSKWQFENKLEIDGKEFSGSIRWEHNSRGEDSLVVNDRRVSDSPQMNMSDLQQVFSRLTGSTDHIGMAYWKEAGDNVNAFTNESTFKMLLYNEGITPDKPMTLFVNTDAEPFFSDSRAGQAGGSGGAHVVVITRPPVMIDGVPHVYVDNTWGPGAQHTADTGRPIPLRDLYLAAIPGHDKERIASLQEAAKTSPLKRMEYYRAMEAHHDYIEKYIKREKLNEDGAANARFVRRDSLLTPEQHSQKLQKLLKDLDSNPSQFSLKPEEVARLKEQAARSIETIREYGTIKGNDSHEVPNSRVRVIPEGFSSEQHRGRDYVVQEGVKLEGTTEDQTVYRQIDRPRLQNKFGHGDLNTQRLLDAIKNGEPLPDYLPKGGADAPINEKDVSQYTASANEKCGVTAVTTDGEYAMTRGQHGDLILEVGLPAGSPHITSHESLARGLDGEAQILVPGIRGEDIRAVYQVEFDKATQTKKQVKIWPPSGADDTAADGTDKINRHFRNGKDGFTAGAEGRPTPKQIEEQFKLHDDEVKALRRAVEADPSDDHLKNLLRHKEGSGAVLERLLAEQGYKSALINGERRIYKTTMTIGEQPVKRLTLQEGERLITRSSDVVSSGETVAKQIKHSITRDRDRTLALLRERGDKFGPPVKVDSSSATSVSKLLRDYPGEPGTSDPGARHLYKQWASALKDFQVKGVRVLDEGAESLAILLENGQVLKIGSSIDAGHGKRPFDAKVMVRGKINDLPYHIQEFVSPLSDDGLGSLRAMIAKHDENLNFFDVTKKQGGMAKRWMTDQEGNVKSVKVPVLIDYKAVF